MMCERTASAQSMREAAEALTKACQCLSDNGNVFWLALPVPHELSPDLQFLLSQPPNFGEPG